jgi:hypothetical protein
VAQLDRDRADADIPSTSLRTIGAGAASPPRDLKCCSFMARITAPTYNRWRLFVRLADPRRHCEVITSRPLLLHAPARVTRHGGQTRLTIRYPRAKAARVEAACRPIAAFFGTLRRTAEQLSPLQRRYRLLSRALTTYLHGRQLQPPAARPGSSASPANRRYVSSPAGRKRPAMAVNCSLTGVLEASFQRPSARTVAAVAGLLIGSPSGE